MRSPASQDDSADGCLAGETGLASSEVDLVLQLKKSFCAVGVYIIGDG